ncbi:actin cytoskeleton-regulatory complex protein PAN1-like isoform X1 [Phragmites australis]|uniref:actin cytoskeleton-regulatory complex protein PAN1-like isoform X1 n=1 Tax=Phragmites australis TaxID=29695 RepID=UPI002D769CD2|nr:actin cytoskeleton-regulatory complex protein PAN1-like isoform X1 [Phragmites australis]
MDRSSTRSIQTLQCSCFASFSRVSLSLTHSLSPSLLCAAVRCAGRRRQSVAPPCARVAAALPSAAPAVAARASVAPSCACAPLPRAPRRRRRAAVRAAATCSVLAAVKKQAAASTEEASKLPAEQRSQEEKREKKRKEKERGKKKKKKERKKKGKKKKEKGKVGNFGFSSDSSSIFRRWYYFRTFLIEFSSSSVKASECIVCLDVDVHFGDGSR